jgi:hypothetical protein
MKIVKDRRIINAILRKMSQENEFDIENICVHSQFKYIETINVRKKDADFCTTEYKGDTYRVGYLSGCFNPFMFKIKSK